MEITVAKTIADTFDFVNHREVILTKVDKDLYATEYIEITFQDQYLGRADMWRIAATLQGQCIHMGQEISFLGSVAGTITAIYIKGAKVDISINCARNLSEQNRFSLGYIRSCETSDKGHFSFFISQDNYFHPSMS